MLQRAVDQQQQQQVRRDGGPVVAQLARLSATPRTLHDVWMEYTVGIGGSKPARDFSSRERGAYKHRYCARKIIWDRVALLVCTGLNAQTACDRIYDVYGHGKSVTFIINALKKDIKNKTLHGTLVV